jgi:HEAT repeat protein
MPHPTVLPSVRSCALFVFLVALVPPLAAQSRADDEQLAEAARLVRSNSEPDLRRGAKQCAEIDTVRSLELLLDVLGADQPHRRDIVWEALPSFQDPEARERVQVELLKSKRNEDLRQWCAQLLGLYGDASAVDALLKALGDKTPAVRASAAQALGRLGDARAVKGLTKLVDDRDPAVRAYAREALVRMDAEAHGDALRTGLQDDDAGVRTFLLGCAPACLPDEVEALSAPMMGDPDWRVRMQAAENLGEVRTRASIGALVAAVNDRRPVVARRLHDSLVRLTGQLCTTPAQWEKWWAAEGPGFDPAAPTPATAPARKPDDAERSIAVRYNDLPIDSDHVAFLIDDSVQMKERLKSVQGTKAENALAELKGALVQLEGQIVFNLFVYDAQTTPFSKQPVPLDARTMKKVLAFVADANPRGSKDIWNALVTAMGDTELDTIYLLASGEPEVGLYVHHNRITEHLLELRRFHKVTVHGVAYTDSDWYASQIEEICKATGGEFRRIQ